MLTAVQTLNLYTIVNKYFNNEADAKMLVAELEQAVENKLEQKKDVLATKIDIHELEFKIERSRSDIIKWMFLFWVGQVVVIGGILFPLYKK